MTALVEISNFINFDLIFKAISLEYILFHFRTDRYRAQDIFLHESAHGVHLLGKLILTKKKQNKKKNTWSIHTIA